MDTNSIVEIPLELEDSLLEAIDKVLRGRNPTDCSFESVVGLVCDCIELEEEYRRTIFSNSWMQRLKRRWKNRAFLNDVFYPQSRPNAISTGTSTYRRRSRISSDSIVTQQKVNFDDSFRSNDPIKTRRRKSNSLSSENDEISSLSSSTNSLKSHNSDLQKQSRESIIRKIANGELEMENVCLSCGDCNVVAKHPLFVGGLCEEHKSIFHENYFKYDSDGYHTCCSICGMGKKVVLCHIRDCGSCYCQPCLEYLVGKNSFREAVSAAHWTCFFCQPVNNILLKKRTRWQEEIQRLYSMSDKYKYPGFLVPQPSPVAARQPIRVLSLFDGIATGMVALKQLGLEIGSFVASEIDEDAIRLVQNRHPDVVHIGDITKLLDDDIYKLGPFDLLLGGSPCNDLSGANPRRKGLLDPEGTGCLFFDFYRVLKIIEPPRHNRESGQARPFFWLFENVVSMKGIEKQRISRFLQCEPRMADARCVSAAARPRLFWGNVPGLQDRKISPGTADRLKVQDCLEPGRKAMVEKLNTITTKFTCLYQGQTRRAPVTHDGKEDILWTTEVEKVFGVPEHYTDVNNLGPRERLALLGRSWSVPVVRILLSPLKEYFASAQPDTMDGIMPWWN